MNKKLTVGKLFGIIFCILAAAGTAYLIYMNIYFGGQMKLVDKYYTALERDDFEGYKACFAEYLQEKITEEKFAESKNEILILQDNEDVNAKTDFDKREKYNSNIHIVYYNLTVYNDDESAKRSGSLPMERENGKWVLS
ncbi:MAG: hypothetical protein NC253_10030 [Ruminococcus sp.]|nr:hypothetical protein [Ruminococcus sp.]MCM1479158.1 hypothetical protein [Muribaculaceae bacterium]